MSDGHDQENIASKPSLVFAIRYLCYQNDSAFCGISLKKKNRQYIE